MQLHLLVRLSPLQFFVGPTVVTIDSFICPIVATAIICAGQLVAIRKFPINFADALAAIAIIFVVLILAISIIFVYLTVTVMVVVSVFPVTALVFSSPTQWLITLSVCEVAD